MSETFLYDVFLSHCAADSAVAQDLAKLLKADGLRVWLDEWSIQLGDPIGMSTEQGLEQSRTLILLLSTSAVA